jgi:2-iminobutanoate/2-iminopropanoate deaminase
MHPLPALWEGHQGRLNPVKQAISAQNGPKAIGPYSPALRAGQWVFLSGQVPFDPATGQLVDGDIATQTRRVLQNIGTLLGAAGLTHAAIVRTTVFLADMNDFAAMNAAYAEFFSEPYPARSTVQAARLPRDARIEIDVIATYETP